MTDNLVFYINKLGYQIVSQGLENERNIHPRQKDERYFRKCMRKVTQKGCDVLLNKSCDPPLQDPCITDYGGNWSPLTLITDYGRELKAQGGGKYNEILLNSIKCLEENQYDCVNELFKLLLLLKKPFVDSSVNVQNDSFFSGSDFLLSSIDSFCLLSDDYSSNSLSRQSSYKKALQYEESWTKHFDSKFQSLGEFSKKNVLTPDKLSLDSLFSAKSLSKSQSQSNSFVFTDFFMTKNYKSEKNVIDLQSNSFSNESTLLDSFVDTPITHKLPCLTISQKPSSKSGVSFRSVEQSRRKCDVLKEEIQQEDSFTTANIEINTESSLKSSSIQLKRDSNCSHSFSILYEKSKNTKSQESNMSSDENFLFFKDRRKGQPSQHSSMGSTITSKEIILGLWEQEHSLIKEFKPELATNFPALRMISLTDFVEDVKYLMTGINSGTFPYDINNNCFNMKYGTCLEDVTPDSLFHFSKEFLNIGNCYVRLSSSATAIGRNSFDTCTTISQAFWKSVFDFLELHYSMVLEIPVTTNLMVLKSYVRDLHDMMTTVSAICKVFKPNETLPQGGELLTYLLQVAEKLNKPCVINIVFGILQNCCSVYFLCILQTWMFKGHLEKQNNEFFVDCRRQKTKTKSRTYYNSFYIAHDKIPSFLRGYEEVIFNCGKSIHFLKLFNLEDKFCQLLDKADYPNMYLCLSEEQLEKLERDFKEYEARVIEICGESVSIKALRNEEKEQEKYYIEYVKKCKKMQEQQRELMRLKELEDLKAKKEMQNKLLNEQRSFIEAEKKRKKLEEERENNKFEEQLKRVAETQAKTIKEEKSLIKNYYDNLLKDLEQKLRIAELRKENLKKLLSTYDTDEANDNIMDVINDNETIPTNENVDIEGNITENIDINSNKNICTTEATVKGDEKLGLGDTAVEKKTEDNVIYDENLNPKSEVTEVPNNNFVTNDEPPSVNKNEVKSPEEKIRKSISHRTIAAEEAAKNKFKVLKSEFGLGVKKEPEPVKVQSQKSCLSDLERNRRKVLESEYDLLKNPSNIISVKPVQSITEITKESSVDTPLPKIDARSSSEIENFEKIELERKVECLDLEQQPEKRNLEPETTKSNSSISFCTPNAVSSDEAVSNELEVAVTTSEPPDVKSILVNVNYQNALTRDAAIFHRKLPYQEIFPSIKQAENSSLPCTDFMKFQRYLKKSVLIPLKIQEKLANDALLKHLLKGENLLSHLKSLRAYFFLNDGEFGRSFTYNTFRSLAKCTEPKQFFERSTLSNIVNEALNYTIHNCEPNSQNLSFQIVKMPPFLNHSSHDVLSPFELSYKVEWPLNIILTEKALSKYKMVFRFLLKLKRISWTLNENFLFLNSQFKSKKLSGKVLAGSNHYHMIQVYRHAMTQVMITLDDYIFSNGVQFPWLFFLKDLETTENIDHLYQKHVRYIKDVLTRCFLSKNSEDLLDCIHNLIELALKFHYTSKSSVFVVVDGKYEHPKFQVLKTTFNEFCAVIKVFIKTLKEKISANQILKSHYILVEKFDLKLT